MIKTNSLNIWIGIIILLLIIFLLYSTCKNNDDDIKENFSYYELSQDLQQPLIQQQQPLIQQQPSQQYNIKIYNFYADWCGYSIQFKPIWAEFEKKIKLNMNKYNISDIRAIEESNCNEMCNTYNIQGFPTVIFEINNKPIVYKGDRSVESLELFLTQKIYDYV